MSTDGAAVRDNAAAHRYELELDGEVVGTLSYRTTGEIVKLIHTNVAPQWEGHGLGEQLVAGALDDVRARGLHIVVLCPFVAAFLRRHPECEDLIASKT
jgi:predicted GNAT family acetyltransferase